VKENQPRREGWRRCSPALFALAILFLLPIGIIRADGSPSGLFRETFASYEYADGARTTAWWDRNGGRLTLRQPDAGHERRWPALAPTTDGGMLVAWVEDRGAGPHIWAQRLDAHGNRLWDEDVALIAWSGEWPGSEPEAHHLAVERLVADAYRLLWRDATGVWTGKWSESAGWREEAHRLAETNSGRVSLRCQEQDCAVIWQEAEQSQFRLVKDDVSQSRTLPGKAFAAWRAQNDLWLAWPDGESTSVQRYDLQMNPRWEPPLHAPGGQLGLADIADLRGNVFLLYLDPIFVSEINGDYPPSAELSEQTRSQSAAVSALWGAAPDRLTMVWQTSDPSALWMRWLDGVSPLSDEMLLRLGIPGAEPILGDVAMTADGAVAVAWTEGDQVFVRKWWRSGGSPWRHEVGPAFDPAPGWVVSEGLGHSLAVNRPWEAVTAVTLQANVATNGGTVQFYVSNQGPTAWKQIAPGQRVTFPSSGTALRWYARLRRSPWGTAPEVREVSLHYDYEWLQHLPLSQLQRRD